MTGGGSTAVEAICKAEHPTYDHRVYIPGAYNWCVVPDEGQDAILFAGVAVCAACLAQGRFANSLILLAGVAVQGFMLPYNLGRFGNGIAIWLGIQPYELFFYIFLPPLLLDAGVRIDFYIFKKMAVQVVTLAFLVVGASVGVMIPVMLYVLDLRSSGWTWEYVALFVSMLASTDAVAIIATMKTSGGPKRLRVLLEGEALLNDASSFTLFEIFLKLVENLNAPGAARSTQSGWSILGQIVSDALKLGLGGLGIGLLFGIACRYALRFMRWMGATIDQQVSLTVALAYLSYYTANSPAHVSGVVSVAAFGLYGAATSKWDMSAKVEESGAFETFWDTLSFITNGLVFFFSGVACINFFVRSSQELDNTSHGAVLASTIWRLPLIYLFMFFFRFVLTAAFQPLFRVFLGGVSWRELLFATVGGLRGSVSLILAQAVVTDQQTGAPNTNNGVIKAEIVLWTAGFVLMTLIINVPLLPLVLRKTGLTKVSDGKQRMRKRAVGALASHTLSSIDNLKQDEDEMLRGVDWQAVERSTTVDGIYAHFMDPSLPAGSGQSRRRLFPALSRRLSGALGRSQPRPPKLQKSLVEEGGKLNTGRLFGRTRGWGSGQDLEAAGFACEDEDELEAAGLEGSEAHVELNELSAASARELPFLGRAPEGPPGLTRSATFASFGRAASARDSRAPLLPITVEADSESGSARAGTAQLDRTLQSGPQPPSPTPSRQLLRKSPAPAGLARKSPAAAKQQLVMTAGGPLMPPWSARPGGGVEEPGAGEAREDSEASAPTLRITGDALRRLVAEGTSGRTWPKIRADAAQRPPLPFARTQSRQEPVAPGGQDAEEAAATTWSGAGLTAGSALSTRRTAGSQQKRPSIFDAFDLERPGTRAAQSAAAAKHRPIFEAFGAAAEAGGGLARADSARSAGSSSRGGLEAASAQQTWTAGMTRGSSAQAFLAQLRRAAESGGDLARPSQAASGLERASAPAAPLVEMTEGELAEARVRLIVGLKRYFHGKRTEGLLSTPALRILDNACDACLERPDSFRLWATLEKDATGTILVKLLAQQTYFWRKAVLALRRRKSDRYQALQHLRRGLAWPLRKAIGFAQRLLAKAMLTGIEVGIEYMLGLTYSPQVQLLRRHETAGKLLDEVQAELDQVWRFILDREVEAPERFQAIQTYRATFAVQQQQLAFIRTMFESGIVDDLEREELVAPLDKRERHLERVGPSYRPPSVMRVLHNTPFLRSAPDRVTEVLFRHGRLVMFRSGSDIAMRQSSSVYLVTSGLVKVCYTDPAGEQQEYFLASGGMLGLYHAMTGLLPPGRVTAIAEGNSLGKGPVVFELFQSGVELVRKRAAAGDALYQQIELDMLRLAALFIVERMKPRLMAYLLQLLTLRARPQPPPSQVQGRLGGRLLRSPFEAPGAAQAEDEAEGLDFEQASAAPTASSGATLGARGELRDGVLQAYTALVHELAAAEVVELPAGLPYTHESSAVLLRGTLKASGRADGQPGGAREEVVEYHAPFVFPRLAGVHAAPLRFVIGYQSGERTGALLMVCPPEGRAPVQPLGSGVREAELPGRAESLGDDRSAPRQSPARAEPAAALARESVRRRAACRALVLDASDAEVAAARSDGRKGAWWDHALARPSLALQRMSQLPGQQRERERERERREGLPEPK